MIHTLNEEGFEIASFPRKGYQLAETSNKLSAEAISVYLKKKLPVYTFEQVDSTNQLLKKMAIDGSEHAYGQRSAAYACLGQYEQAEADLEDRFILHRAPESI